MPALETYQKKKKKGKERSFALTQIFIDIGKFAICNFPPLRHSLMLLWFANLMNVTEEVTIHRPHVSTLLPSAFIRGDLNAATRDPFIWSLISGLFSDEV